MWYKKQLPDNLTKRELDRLKAYIGQANSDMNLVGQYENAIDILINHIVKKGDRIDLIASPLLYLIRHSIELALKENIRYLNKYSHLGLGKIQTHSIDNLFSEFERHYNKIANDLSFKVELESEYDKYTNDLKKLIHSLGTDWSSFRYTKSNSGTKVFDHTKILNIYEMKNQFDTSMVFLTHTVDAISEFTDYVDYLGYDPSVESISKGFVKYRFPISQKEWLIKNLNKSFKTSKIMIYI